MNKHVHPTIADVLNAFAPLAHAASEISARFGKPLPLPGETPLAHAKRLSKALHPCPAPKQIERLAADIEAADTLPERMGSAIKNFRTAEQKRQAHIDLCLAAGFQPIQTSDGRPVSQSGVELDHDDHFHDKREQRSQDHDAGHE